jgi:uncharacterized protein with FMN-binding domain
MNTVMKKMSKLTRFLAAAAIISAATVVAAIHPQWGRGAGIALLFILLAALIAAGILALRSRTSEKRSARKNISPTLATLSSAAILAVYAAGYHRTTAVAGGFSEKSNRPGPTVQIASSLITPEPSAPQFDPSGDRSAAPKLAAQPIKVRTNHGTKRVNVAGDASSISTAAPTQPVYATAVPAAPQASAGSISSASTPAVEVPQIAMAAADPNVQLPETSMPAAPPKPKAMYKDGTYYGWGSCRHGDIQASVTIQDGRIASANITQCLTRYSCSWIAALPGQVVKRQSPEVDYVSGASQSTDAFYGAIVSALAKAHF